MSLAQFAFSKARQVAPTALNSAHRIGGLTHDVTAAGIFAVDEHPLLASYDARIDCAPRYHRAGASVSMLSGRA